LGASLLTELFASGRLVNGPDRPNHIVIEELAEANLKTDQNAAFGSGVVEHRVECAAENVRGAGRGLFVLRRTRAFSRSSSEAGTRPGFSLGLWSGIGRRCGVGRRAARRAHDRPASPVKGVQERGRVG